jgi:hypothetical protein
MRETRSEEGRRQAPGFSRCQIAQTPKIALVAVAPKPATRWRIRKRQSRAWR